MVTWYVFSLTLAMSLCFPYFGLFKIMVSCRSGDRGWLKGRSLCLEEHGGEGRRWWWWLLLALGEDCACLGGNILTL